MAVPKKRKSHSRTRMQRSHQALLAPRFQQCPQCQALCLPHHICMNCGFYRGKSILPKSELSATR